jgi:hypothetical protein
MSDDNPIIEEIREIREQMLAEHGGNMSAYLASLRRRTQELTDGGRIVVTRSPRPVRQPQQPRKAG